jgi:hypothetical protein
VSDFLVLKGGTVYDGRYPFDLDSSDFTVREWGWIKRHAGYLPLTVEEGFAGADPELYVVFAVIALVRANRVGVADVPRVLDVLAEMPGTLTIRFETDPDEEEEAAEEPLPPSRSRSSSESDASSGNGSRVSSEISPLPRRVSGTPDSATSESRRAT